MALKIRDALVNEIGTRAAHAVEDGLTAGIIAGLLVTFPPLGLVLATVLLGVPTTKGPLAIIMELPDLVRGEDARRQEAYFSGATALGGVIGVLVGALLAFAALNLGVRVPFGESLLSQALGGASVAAPAAPVLSAA